jgi:hypothetical protein
LPPRPPFAPGGVEIRTSFSDNLKTAAAPIWSAGAIVAATAADGQASIPRFAASSSNAYVAWRRFPFPGTFFGFGNTVAFARSLDNGATWQSPIETSAEFFTMDQVLGNDRVNTSPSLAVDNSRGPRRGNIFLVYANNNSGDGADIVFQRSKDKGLTFSAPIELNAAPGEDRPQHVQQMRKMLAGVVQSGTGRAANPGRWAAGKTGTTSAHRDAWFVGFTERYVAGVWLGNTSASTPMDGVTGGGLPAQVWRAVMMDASKA